MTSPRDNRFYRTADRAAEALSLRATTGEDHELVERLIDRHGLGPLLFVMAEICVAKACHIAENWQDARLAKQWERSARRVENTARAVRHWLP